VQQKFMKKIEFHEKVMNNFRDMWT